MAYHIYILDPAQYKVWFAGQSYGTKVLLTVEDWCKQEDAELCFNLTTFGWQTRMADTYVRSNGRDIAYGKEKYGISLLDIGGGNQCLGYSNGIIGGVVSINHPFGGRSYRNGIGMTDRGHIIIAQSTTMVTEAAFCQEVNRFVIARGQRVKLFLLQDGGGSVSEYSSVSKLAFYATKEHRPVATVVCVRRRTTQTLTRVLHKKLFGDDVEMAQIIIGGTEADKSYGPGFFKRVVATQAALGMDPEIRCGIISALTAKKLGFDFRL